MPNEIDKSLLDRLQALRGSSEPPESPSSPKISVDVIERSKTPTREDALAARLKSLRGEDGSTPPSLNKPSASQSTPTKATSPGQPSGSAHENHNDYSSPSAPRVTDPISQSTSAIDDSLFQTDDNTLEELLGDVSPDDSFAGPENKHTAGPATEPSDEQVKALLEQLSDSVPRDEARAEPKPAERDEDRDEEEKGDDSDGDEMKREVDDVISRFRDEAELDATLGRDEEQDQAREQAEQDDDENSSQQQYQHNKNRPHSNITLPSVPSDPATSTTTTPSHQTDLASITARLSALRSSSSSPPPSSASASLSLPSVPTSKPSKQPNRLTSRTNYTDDDVDSWCTVCLEDATLRCLGCDGDPYCARCWREMHVGPAAGFDERSHRAVQFTKDRKKKEGKVALGA